MPDPESKNDNARPGGFLRPGDQYVVAVGAFVGFVCLLTWWIYRGGLQGGLIEVDRAAEEQAAADESERVTVPFSVDVNMAEWPQFAQLPGIGEELARRIVAERERGGEFMNTDDIARRVAGIGPKKMEQIGRYLRLSNPNDEDVDD